MPMRPKTHAQLQFARRSPEDRPQPRGSASERGYDYRWQKARAAFLARHPLCLYCRRQGRTTVATLVDHSRPPKGDMAIFWDRSLWVPACRPCHDHVTLHYDGGRGRPQRPRDGHYVPPLPGELAD